MLGSSYFLIGLIFFTPIIYSSHLLFGITTARGFVFRIAVELLFLVYLYLVIENRKYAPKSSLTLWSIIGLFLALTSASIINGTIISSFWGNLIRMDGLLSFGHLLIFFLIVSNLIKSLRAWQSLLQVLLFVGFISSLIGISQSFGQPILLVSGGGARVTATTGNAVYLGAYLVLLIFVSIFLLLEKKIKDLSVLMWLMISFDALLIFQEIISRVFLVHAGFLTNLVSNLPLFFVWLIFQAYCIAYYFWYKRYQYNIFLSLLIVVNLWALLLTQAKGAWLSLILGLFVWLVAIFFKYLSRSKRLAIMTATLVILISLSFMTAVEIRRQFVYTETPGLFSRLMSEASFRDRSYVWGAAWQAIKDRPILGWGVENFDLVFDKYFPSKLYQSADSRVWFDKAHNQYLQMAVEGGLFALLFYLLIFVSAFKRIVIWSRTKGDGFGPHIFFGLLIAYLIQSLVYFDVIYVSVLIFFILGMLDNLGKDGGRDEHNSSPKKIYFLNNLFKVPYVFHLLLFLATILFIYNFNLRQIYANYYFVRTDNKLAQMAYTDTNLISELGSKINNFPSLGKAELRDGYADIVKKFTINGDNEISSQLIVMAEEQLIKNTQKRLKAVLPYVKLANYYYFMGPFETGLWGKGIAVVEKAQSINGERDQLLYFLGEFYLQKEEIERGLNYYKMIADKLPDVAEAQVRYYSALQRLNRNEEADVVKARVINAHPEWLGWLFPSG